LPLAANNMSGTHVNPSGNLRILQGKSYRSIPEENLKMIAKFMIILQFFNGAKLIYQTENSLFKFYSSNKNL